MWVGSVDYSIDERKVYITAVMTDDKKYFRNHLDLGFLDNGECELVLFKYKWRKGSSQKFKIWQSIY